MPPIKLSIPTPCHEDWNAMSAKEKGRYCSSCQKTVVDFTGMSDSGVAAFFKNVDGPVCGRFFADQLERPLRIPKKRISWIRYFFTIALPAVLWSQRSNAQGEVRVKTEQQVPGEKRAVADTALVIISGTVIDVNGNPIPFATVRLKDANLGAKCDEKGEFKFQMNKAIGTLEITAVGYDQRECKVSSQPMRIFMSQSFLGEVVVFKCFTRKAAVVQKEKKLAIDSTSNSFSISPNPALSHGIIKIGREKLQKGNYLVEVVNASGVVIQTAMADFKQSRSIQLSLDMSMTGMYYLRLSRSGSSKSYTQKLLVQ